MKSYMPRNAALLISHAERLRGRLKAFLIA